MALCLPWSAGCEVDSWFDPSRTGYFEHTPTSIPVLRRIDVIEVEQEPFATEVGPPKPEDLLYGPSEYQFGAGDVVEVQIQNLFQDGRPEIYRRQVDQSGRILLPVVGQVEVAGLTHMQLVNEITQRLSTAIVNPEVDVQVIDARSYTFTMNGDVRNPGVYTLSRPNFSISDAVAMCGGADTGTRRVRIVRVLPDISDANLGPASTRVQGGAPSGSGNSATPTTPPSPTAPPTVPSVPTTSIEDLINRIGGSDGGSTPPASTEPAAPPSTSPSTSPSAPPSAGDSPAPIEPPPPPAPPAAGMVRTPVAPVDIDLLDAPSTQDKPVLQPETGVRAQVKTVSASEEQWYFDQEKQDWVMAPAAEVARIEQGARLGPSNSPDGAITGPAAASALHGALMPASEFRLPTGQKTRIIEADWTLVKKGNSMQDVIVRPDDRIFVEVDVGVIYIDGEIARPGVYSLPAVGDITLSRLVAAAGGLGQIAIPQRVDLIRKVAPDREAVIRVNLAAIRNRAEPDIVLRADDHVIIGTSFIATPLAVIRNGFRMTYGFGFLLDRNFGNDVFGAPPGSSIFN